MNFYNYTFAAILTAGLQLASVRAIFKYIPYQPVAFLVIIMGSFITWVLVLKAFQERNAFYKFLQRPVFAVLMLLGIAIASFVVYPKADALKKSGGGSDADDAIIVATKRLWNGEHPYTKTTYLGNRISPGPGILLAFSPFVLTNTYFLALPFFVFLFAILIKKLTGDWNYVNVAMLATVSALGFWEYMFIGSDLFAIGVLILLVFYLSLKYQNDVAKLIVIAIIAGILLTSRIHLVYLAPVIAYIILKSNFRSGLIFGLVACITSALIHFTFYSWDPDNYAPMHLLAKGQSSMSTGLLISAAITNISLLLVFLLKKQFNRTAALFYFWLFLALPHFFIGLSRALADGFRHSISEGPGYLIIQMAALVAFVMVAGAFTKRNGLQEEVKPAIAFRSIDG